MDNRNDGLRILLSEYVYSISYLKVLSDGIHAYVQSTRGLKVDPIPFNSIEEHLAAAVSSAERLQIALAEKVA